MGRGRRLFQGVDYFKYFHLRGVIIDRGTAIIRGNTINRKIFSKEIKKQRENWKPTCFLSLTARILLAHSLVNVKRVGPEVAGSAQVRQ